MEPSEQTLAIIRMINFYYLEHEYEPAIIMVDSNRKEAYSINALDLTSIEEIPYPSTEELTEIIEESTNQLYGGSWEDIKFVLNNPATLAGLALSDDRKSYIEKLSKPAESTIETDKDRLLELIWEIFENKNATDNNTTSAYNIIVTFINGISNNKIKKYLEFVSKNKSSDNLSYIISEINKLLSNIDVKSF